MRESLPGARGRLRPGEAVLQPDRDEEARGRAIIYIYIYIERDMCV